MALQQVARVGRPARPPERISAAVPLVERRRLQQPASVPGHTAVRFAARSPASLPLRRSSLVNPLGSRARRPTGPTDTAGERGARQKAPPTRAHPPKGPPLKLQEQEALRQPSRRSAILFLKELLLQGS